jgi:8-amino-7-oxononanoate synthase
MSDLDDPLTMATLIDLLNYRACHQPDQTAYTFLVDGETEVASLTYQALDQRSRAIAARLQFLKATGERAILLYPPGLDFIAAFFGCLYAGVTAVPTYPPQQIRKAAKLKTIMVDAQASLALTTNDLLNNLQDILAQDLPPVRWLATDTLEDAEAANWHELAIASDTLALLQYTSGSTGTPKGVMVSHANLLANAALIQHTFQDTSESLGVSWLPPYHDMGLIGGVLQPLYVGRPTILLSPVAFLQKPLRWLQAISKYKATTSGGPNFAYDLCIQKITSHQRATLDLSSWKVAFNGAEPIRARTLENFTVAFEVCGFRSTAFYPCYGMAEATLMISGGLSTSPPLLCQVDGASLEKNQITIVPEQAQTVQTLVGCGQAWLEQTIVIVNPDSLQACPADVVGEIWVSSPSVAQGYWNQPNETDHIFKAHLADTGEGPFLRTGDLGFLHHGELFVTGRLKDVIIIRGRNHYPQDIEWTVQQAHPGLRVGCGAAFSLEVEGAERLVIVQEVERRSLRQLDAKAVISSIRQAISEEHQLQVYAVLLLKPATIPKTSSGKIQRFACRAGFLEKTLNPLEEWCESQVNLQEIQQSAAALLEQLSTAKPQIASNGHKPDYSVQTAEQISQAGSPLRTTQEIQSWVVANLALHLKVLPQEIDLKQPLTHYGLDSSQVISLASELSIWLGRELDPMLLWDYPSIEALTQYLSSEFQVLPSVDRNNHRQSTERNGSVDAALNGSFTQTDGIYPPRQFDEIPPAFYEFQSSPEYLTFQQFLEEGKKLGNPFFLVHEGITRDTTYIDGQELINYSSYNYLGLSGDLVVSAAAKAAIDQYGTSVSASRLVSGERPLHRELEHEIAEFLGTEDCIVYIGGHTTNVTTIGHLFGKKDLILHDALSHNSIVMGCSLSGATTIAFPHNDPQALDRLLREHRYRYEKVLIVIEGVYSADGDLAPLPAIIEVKKRHKAFLMVDEAHSIGVLGTHGRGIGEYFEVDPTDVDLWMGTLSKSLASCGGYIAGSKAVVDYLKYTSPGFVFSVGMSPANAAATLMALRVLKVEPERVSRLQQRAKLFLELAKAQGLNTGRSHDSPVVPIILNDTRKAVQLSRQLFERGINVQPLIYPSVPQNAPRLRFFITCNHTEAQIRFTAETLAQELAKIENSQNVKV